MRFSRDCSFEIVTGSPDWQTRCWITCFLEVFQMSVCVPGFAFGSRAEHRSDVVVTLHIGLGGEVQVTAVCLRLAGKCVFQVLFSFGIFKSHHLSPSVLMNYATALVTAL